MNKIIVPISIVAAIGAGAFAVVKMNSASSAQSEYDKVNAELAAQKKAIADAVAGLNKASDELATLKANNDRLKRERDEANARAKEAAENAEKNAGIAAAEVEKDPNAKKAEEGIRNIIEGFAKQMDNPDVKKAMASGQARMIEGAYGKLFSKLNLPEADKALVTELISDRNMAAFDIGRKLMGGKADEATVQQVRADIAATKADYDTKLKSVLGEQKFAEMSTYEQTVGDQRLVDRFARTFEREGIALQPQQQDALLSIMREERMKNPSTDIPDLGGGPGMAVLYTEEEAKLMQQKEEAYQQNVIARAGAAGLTPDQVTALQDQFKQRNEQQTMGRAMGRAFLGGFGNQK